MGVGKALRQVLVSLLLLMIFVVIATNNLKFSQQQNQTIGQSGASVIQKTTNLATR